MEKIFRQTAEPYSGSRNAETEPYEEDSVDGSIVEFTGLNIENNGVMSRYILDYLVVYPIRKKERFT